jgi:hypothetical protein
VDGIFSYLDGLGWLLLMLGPLLFFQRRLHRELQMVLLLITRRPIASLGIFSLLFFPGVLLHEFSHFIMAQFLMVKTGGFSLMPSLMQDGKLRLGYVETAETDLVRDALIGTAPLLSGGAAIAYLASQPLGFTPLASALWQNRWSVFWDGLVMLPQQTDFWLWFYLAFTISSTMLPSASDRRAWLPLGLVFAGLAGVALLAGAGPWLLANLAEPLNRVLRLLTTIFGVSLAMHLVLIVPLFILRTLLAQLMGVRVVQQG